MLVLYAEQNARLVKSAEEIFHRTRIPRLLLPLRDGERAATVMRETYSAGV